MQAGAAVPVEDSVADDAKEAAAVQPVQQTARQPLPSRRVDLDIPPTIEPGQVQTQAAAPDSVPVGGVSNPVAGGNGGLADLFYQMQLMQQELQTLQGVVEEQAYEIRRLRQENETKYAELDRRFLGLVQGGSGAERPAAAVTSTSDPITAPADGSPAEPGLRPAATERDAYRQAFDAMRGRQFDVSMQAFQKLIEDYPNGQYTPNAFYWIGEIFLVAQQDAEQARQSFMQVVNLYPDHQKAPDALYKLGVVYATLGDAEASKRYLDRVQREYPDSSAAGLAQKYAAELN
ncbi:MAG: tol-pal system protein YbgF [Pseudomonadota bacterium]